MRCDLDIAACIDLFGNNDLGRVVESQYRNVACDCHLTSAGDTYYKQIDIIVSVCLDLDAEIGGQFGFIGNFHCVFVSQYADRGRDGIFACGHAQGTAQDKDKCVFGCCNCYGRAFLRVRLLAVIGSVCL